jgi:hypothetical protein
VISFRVGVLLHDADIPPHFRASRFLAQRNQCDSTGCTPADLVQF